MKLNIQRPQSLYEAATFINQGASWRHTISEFLDTFYISKEVSRVYLFEDEPPLMNSRNPSYGYWQDAYHAGIAEYLLTLDKVEIYPAWINHENRFLKTAFYANAGLASLNAILYEESPIAFRRRLIYTEDRPCRRASMNLYPRNT